MVKIHTIDISPPLINSSCAWSSDLDQLRALYNSRYTGAVTTRTATIDGFREDESHTVAFTHPGTSSINSYGYSPHPLSQYLSWIEHILSPPTKSTKPFIISIAASTPSTLLAMLIHIQTLRNKLTHAQIAVELNTSCPNIRDSPPSGYTFSSLTPLLIVLQDVHKEDPSLTLGLKLPPFVHRDQFISVMDGIKALCYPSSVDGGTTHSTRCPLAFLTCTNTLGSTLAFDGPGFALPTAVGGTAGDAIHALSLGNVYTFSQLLLTPEYAVLSDVGLIGVGGVTSKEAKERMHAAGAVVVGCATLFGKEGVTAFGILSGAD